MNKPTEQTTHKAIDGIQQQLTRFACDLKYSDLPPEVIHAAKARVIDTLGVLIGGYFNEACRIVRDLGAQMPSAHGATMIGTRTKTTPDMAAFVNATTARDAEMTDTYHWPGSFHGHPSDVITPILAAAEYAQASGREFITSVVVGYEIYLRFSNIFDNKGFDHTNFCCVGAAAAAAKLLKLSTEQTAHCISMAVVPNNILGQRGLPSMFKTVASGHAGRAAVFAALLAEAGMEGPHLPFEGKSGWCDHIARKRFTLEAMGGDAPFRILNTRFKYRPSPGNAISSVLAAEKVAPVRNKDVQRVTLEVYGRAKELMGTNPKSWAPESRDAADHSLPYHVGVTLMDGTVTLRSFSEARFGDPELRALMNKIEIVENAEFTKAFETAPVQHRTRITILTNDGKKIVGEAGGDKEDLAKQSSDEQLVSKFRSLTEDYFGAGRVSAILDQLWHLEDVASVTAIPPAFVLA